jgi:tritrans,polycis-undecaprenyl-diphosphate synthase [geranylgeranyl-diphosphate specific]
MKRPWKGHEWGVNKVKEVFEWCKELGVKIITVYSLSLENLEGRPKNELEFLFNLARNEVKDIIENKDNFVHKNRIKVIFFGRLDLLPKDLQESMKKAMKTTKNYSSYFINFAIAYGGRQEIIDASRSIAFKIKSGELKPENVNENVFRKGLQTNGSPDPDLIIRTGGEKRLSNFLTFQTVYSELVFLDPFWPELSKKDFFSAVEDFRQRNRRFGK